VSLGAVLLLVVNDHLLKQADVVPAAITGKLSDLAGLAFFPLLLTALVDLVLLGVARLGPPVDFTLGRRKLAAAIAATGAVFTAVKLSPDAAHVAADALTALGIRSHIVADPSDLLALPALAIAAAVGLAEIARVPLGRLELCQRRATAGRDPGAALADLARRWPHPPDPERSAAVRALADGLSDYFATGDPAAATEALRWFRAPRGSRARRP